MKKKIEFLIQITNNPIKKLWLMLGYACKATFQKIEKNSNFNRN